MIGKIIYGDNEITVPRPPRAQMLVDVADLVSGARNLQHGDPDPQLTLAGELKQLVRAYATGAVSPGEWECIELILTKISRWAMGKVPNTDNPMDIAGYAACGYEIMRNRLGVEKEDDPDA